MDNVSMACHLLLCLPDKTLTLTEALNPQEVEAEAKEFESKYQEFMTFIQY